MNQYKRLNNEHIKQECFEYLGSKKCCVCDTNTLPPICYDFHHYIGAKEKTISQMISLKTKFDDELRKELDKCKILCANCHRQVTSHLIIIKK